MNELVRFQEPRLPYHPVMEERFNVSRVQWKALVEAVYPAAKTIDAVAMALAYCQARNLDPFKRPVHIVPVWDSTRSAMVETVWPGISELRTTAMRTKQFAGCDEVEFGPDYEQSWTWTDKKNAKHEATVLFPEWARMTVYREFHGDRVRFVGPKVFWLETYASIGKSNAPNDMWRKRPRGQLEKCAEAGALRRAFPEELGDEPTAEEMEGREVAHAPIHHEPQSLVGGFKPKEGDTGPSDVEASDHPGKSGEAPDASQDAEFEPIAEKSEIKDATEERHQGVIGFRKIGAKDFRRADGHPGEGWEPVWGYIDTAEMIGDGACPGEDADAEGAARPTETAPAQSAEPSPDTSASATPASTASAEGTSTQADTSTRSVAGPAVPGEGEVYMLLGDTFDQNGRRATYKDGTGWSRITEKAAAKLKEYTVHAPQVDAPAAEPEPMVQSGAEPTTSSDAASSEASPSPAGTATGASPFDLDAFGPATSWLGAKQTYKTLAATETWIHATAPEQLDVMRALWSRYLDLEVGGDQPKPQEDLLLMELWMMFGAERKADLAARWPAFWKGAYKSAPEAEKQRLNELRLDTEQRLP